MLFDLLLNPVASVINRGIDENDQAQNLCDALDGRSLRITAKPLPDPILISAVDGLVDISTDDQQQADAEISGTLIELNRLMFIDSRAPLHEGHVAITGDVDIADRFRELLLCARPNLEEEIADWFGASMASRFTHFVRDTRDRITDVAEDLTERTADYLHKSTQQLPVPTEINTHFGTVDEFVNSVERLEARIDRLMEKQST